MTDHTIVAIRRIWKPGCDQCGPTTPHNVVARCACGRTSAGKSDHIWTVTARDGDRVTLAPSFAWANDEGEGEHLHEFVVMIPDETGQPFRAEPRP